MLSLGWPKRLLKVVCLFLLMAFLGGAMAGCRHSPVNSAVITPEQGTPIHPPAKLTEASVPVVIQQLSQRLEQYQPQVTILSPQNDQTIPSTSVSVQLQIKDLPLFQDADLGLGPHIHLFLDDLPYQAVYDTSTPIVLENLVPGTHTLRAFASMPWHESFKNEGAYAQVTFHSYAKTDQNAPKPGHPLLTYSRPQGPYGAEPIMLDYYLVNAPLHFLAQESTQDEVADWQIRATVNGESFVIDHWQPIYLKGFEPGANWVQLELLDDRGEPIENAFNNSLRVIDYQPNGQDTLSKLVRNELSLAEAGLIVDPNFVLEPEKAGVSQELEATEKRLEETVNEAIAPTADDRPLVQETEDSQEAEIVQEDEAVDLEASPDVSDETVISVPQDHEEFPNVSDQESLPIIEATDATTEVLETKNQGVSEHIRGLPPEESRPEDSSMLESSLEVPATPVEDNDVNVDSDTAARASENSAL